MTKTIVVTGGMGALGRATIAELAKWGDVVALDIGSDEKIDGAVSVFGGVDLTDASMVAGVFAEIAGRTGSIDGIVNAAGGFDWQTLAEGDPETWERLFRINLLSAVTTLKAAFPVLTKPGAAVVNVGAAATVDVKAGMGAYAASKAGVQALTEALADEWASEGIRVNAVMPTVLDTPANRRDMPGVDHAAWVATSDAAKAIAFLVSEAAAAVTGASIKLAMPPVAILNG